MMPQNDPFFVEPPYEPLSWWDSWLRALTKPSVDTFERIANDPQASTIRAATWIFFSSLLGLFISIPLILAFNPNLVTQVQQLTGELGSALAAALGLMLCIVPFSAAISTVGMMISTALVQLAARLLGGRGTFEGTFNALAAITAPITPVTSLLGAIPLVGGCLVLPIGLYMLVLDVIAVKASNRFGWGAAIAAILLPGLVIGGLCCCAAFAIASAAGVAFQDLINQGVIPMPQP
jgi:Ni/Fe-hydrogenase subunit HybB-like protein